MGQTRVGCASTTDDGWIGITSIYLIRSEEEKKEREQINTSSIGITSI